MVIDIFIRGFCYIAFIEYFIWQDLVNQLWTYCGLAQSELEDQGVSSGAECKGAVKHGTVRQYSWFVFFYGLRHVASPMRTDFMEVLDVWCTLHGAAFCNENIRMSRWNSFVNVSPLVFPVQNGLTRSHPFSVPTPMEISVLSWGYLPRSTDGLYRWEPNRTFVRTHEAIHRGTRWPGVAEPAFGQFLGQSFSPRTPQNYGAVDERWRWRERERERAVYIILYIFLLLACWLFGGYYYFHGGIYLFW